MYRYTDFDRQFVRARAAQYRDQLMRHLSGELAGDDFRPLRLQNGWYVQRHAPMLRVAVPYGELSSRQLRQLARIAREHDLQDAGTPQERGGFGHFTTRQNLQFNWIPLERSADVMDLLADVDMHGIQTSGNCIRNITTDALAGIAPDEVVDPRPYCEILRQWSTLHPEFAFLPRKFKIAVTGATGMIGVYICRALLKRGAHVIGVVRNPDKADFLRREGVEFRKADLLDYASLERAFVGIDAVVSNAALYQITNMNWEANYGPNKTGTENVFNAAGKNGKGSNSQCGQVDIGNDTAGELEARLAVLGARMCVDVATRIRSEGLFEGVKQDPALVTKAPKLRKEDGLIDWTLSAQEIAHRVRGLSPWPGAYTYVNGERWTLCRVSVGEESPQAAAGTVTKVTKDRIDVATGAGTIQILDIQPSNSRRMTVAQYLAGHRMTEGISLHAVPPPQA